MTYSFNFINEPHRESLDTLHEWLLALSHALSSEKTTSITRLLIRTKYLTIEFALMETHRICPPMAIAQQDYRVRLNWFLNELTARTAISA